MAMEHQNVLFAAANTSGGFVSQFGTLFSPDSGEWEKIYIIKGGPGTGKSSFMRRIGDMAEKRGLQVDYLLCSSDTKSLDGVRIPALGVAVLDGTAPHTVDPIHPGAVEEIINMGMFFDLETLRAHLPEIRDAQERNGAAHRMAARYLHAAGELREMQRKLAVGAYLEEKARKAAGRMIGGKSSRNGENMEPPRFATAISTQGIVHLRTPEQAAGKRIYVSDKRRTASFFLETLWDEAQRRGIAAIRYAYPLCPSETEGVYLPVLDTVYYTDCYGTLEASDTVLNTDRFFDHTILTTVREKYRFAGKCVSSLLEGACDALAEAGRIHDDLETYYIASMDFSAQDAFIERFLHTLFA